MRADHRPDPDALLAALCTAGRGRLKILLGAAPGVGKTFAMLQAAHELTEQGVDVVAAVVETHGRAETQALLGGLEVLPRAAVDYHGARLSEMDLNAVLARAPRVALVDELAHTNAPGCRHLKRYLDVEELLAAGIDVITTVNVQHVESLNDAVAQITGVRVQETVPDRFFAQADELEVIDLPTDDLLRRLEEGKVYLPDTAALAARRFFRPGNLTALRELALRQAADRVGDQMRSYMQAHAIDGPWPTRELLLVCVSPSPLSPRLVRTTCRLAGARRCPWIAVYVKGSRHLHLTEADRDRVAQTLRLAEELGGDAVSIAGENVADAVADYAARHNVTEIVVGKSLRGRWAELMGGSIINDLIRAIGTIDIYVVNSDTPTGGRVPAARSASPPGAPARAWWASIAAVAVAGLVGAALGRSLALPNLSMLFLVAVLYSATTWGLWPAICAAVLSLLVYDFFFVEPFYRFTVANPQDVLALCIYLLVAVFASRLTAKTRDQAEIAARRESQTSALLALSRRVAAAGTRAEVADAVAREAADCFGSPVALLLPDGAGLRPDASWPAGTSLTDAELAAASYAWQHREPAGQGSGTLTGVAWYCLPLLVGDRSLGVLATRVNAGRPLSPSQRRLLQGFADLAGAAIERAGAS
ncbi:MAG: sensor histidine kinase KdpD [Armatimonadetes bacterium]|nr:sensor histidine kinase KdpD [Armatimonadota bacterium]